jgi:ribosomal protein L25 (general stress protein Ctc)
MAQKIKEIRDNLISIGDDAKAKYNQSKDLKAALIAVKAYGEATKTAVTQVQYKKLTGNPTKIEFLEE